MSRSKLASVVAAVAVLAACGGGTKSSPPPPPQTYTITGSARVAPATEMDADVRNPSAPAGNNDAVGSAQELPSAVTVGGWAGLVTNAGPVDSDYYRVRLAAGQVVTLDIGDPSVSDLDLGLYFVTSGALAASSATSAAVESVSVPASEDYYVVVAPYIEPGLATSTNYVLSISRGAASAAAPGALDATAEFVPGEVIVRFRDDLPFAAGVETLAARAASVGLAAKAGGPRREMLLEFPAGAAARAAALAANGVAPTVSDVFGVPIVDDLERERQDTIRLVEALRRRADVATADLNHVRRALAVPNDSYYPLQWHYPLMNLPQAWDVTDGTRAGNPVVVAVIDTGILPAHPDFAGKIVGGYDFIADPTRALDGNGIDSTPTDEGTSQNPGQSSWHGTHVAGTIAAASNNGAGVAGVSWGARIMPLRVLGLNGSGTGYDILQAVRYAARLPNDSGGVPAQRADVINLSLGGSGSSASEQAVYDQVRAAGVIVVAAAGNDNTSQLFYPASYNGVISVSAVDMQGNKAPYSNYGTAVDVAAPGGDMGVDLDGNSYPDGILSTVGDDSDGTLKMAYWFMQGTSMASPHMAGVAALMRAVCPALTPAQLDGALSSGALTYDLGAAGPDDVYGHGFIDAFRAVNWASDPAHCASTTGTVQTTISATPSRLDFVPAGATSAVVTIAKLGNDTVSGVTHAGKPSWLTVTAITPTAGIAQFLLTPNASGLPNGVYSGAVTFNAAPIGKSVTVQVTLQVGAGGGTATASAGYVYTLLIDAADPTRGFQVEGAPASGSYAFSFTGVPAGRYYLVAGSDSDNDEYICDAGESCGAYPTLSQPAEIDAATSPRGLTFQVGFTSALGGLSAGTGDGGGLVIPPGGLRLPSRLRTPAVRP